MKLLLLPLSTIFSALPSTAAEFLFTNTADQRGDRFPRFVGDTPGVALLARPLRHFLLEEN